MRLEPSSFSVGIRVSEESAHFSFEGSFHFIFIFLFFLVRSGDSTARLWEIQNLTKAGVTSTTLNHSSSPDEKSKDITTLDWNVSVSFFPSNNFLLLILNFYWMESQGAGTMLATGSYDGVARIWTEKGQLRNTLAKHKGPIFSLKWNKSGDYLLSASVDKTAIIWDTKTGDMKQHFENHSGWDSLTSLCQPT